MGRPNSHTPGIETEILERLAAGESLNGICKSQHLPSEAAIRAWSVTDQPPGFSAKYAAARARGYDAIAESTFAIADDLTEDANSRRVRIDTRKWFLSKLAPKKYGDRIEIAGDKENPLEVNIGAVELLKTRIDSLIARGGTSEPPTGTD
jgi:hypothetical protein